MELGLHGLHGFDEGAVFRSLFTAYPDGLLLVDLQGRIVLSNPAALDLLGYEADDLTGRSVDELVPDAIRPRHAEYRGAYADHPRRRPMGTQMDLVAKRRDGGEVMVEIALSPLQDHGLPYVVAAIRGVGAYPRVRQALQRARYAEYLAQFGRLAVDAREPQGLIAEVPRIAAEALQVEMAKVLLLDNDQLSFRIAAGVGMPPEERLGDRIPNAPDSPSGHVVSTGEAVLTKDYATEQRFRIPEQYVRAGMVCELSVPLADRGRIIGTLAVRSRSPNRFGDDETRFLVSLSSTLATVLQRTASEEALNHAQRLETVGQLTGGVAHDFNNLLTVISGSLQVLQEAPGSTQDATLQQLLGAAMRATRRATELTSKLLAFSRRQVLEPTVIDASALLASLTDMLRRTLDQRVVITLDTPDEALCIADPVQLESALLNIAINARDAMPLGGRLSIRCRIQPELPAGLQGTFGRPENRQGYVAIAMADTGSGMTESVRERAFEPFFTTKETGRGTGLGLSTVYGFASQSKGAVTLDSAIGQGTTVTLFLPRMDPSAEDDIAVEAPQVLPAGRLPRDLRVLLVEDDPEVMAVARRFLGGMGCEVSSVGNAEDALACLEEGSVFDLLLTDVSLGPGLRGTDLADETERRWPALPVLLMSGFSSELIDETPGRELLRKPYTRQALEAAMLRVIAARRAAAG